MAEPDVRAWYCKGKKSTGKPVEVQHRGGDVKDTSNFSREGCMRIRMKYDNAHPRARRSGATTVLEVYDLPESACRS